MCPLQWDTPYHDNNWVTYILYSVYNKWLNSISVEFSERIRPTSVDSVRPLYGPVAGGTRVTITGHFPSMSAITAVYFGQREGIIDRNRWAYVLLLVSFSIS